MRTCCMPGTLTSFLQLNFTSTPRGGTLQTLSRSGNSVTCSNSHRNWGSSNSTPDDHFYNMLPSTTRCYFCQPFFSFPTTSPHVLKSLSISHYKAVGIKLPIFCRTSLPEPEWGCFQHPLHTQVFCFFLCSGDINCDGGGGKEEII